MTNLRNSLIASAVLGTAAACSMLPAAPSRPSEVSLLVDAPAGRCDPSVKTVKVRLKLANDGSGTLRVYIATVPGPPYDLSWLAYAVVSASEGHDAAWQHGPGGHGPVPQNQLNVGPKDSTIVTADVYGLEPKDYGVPYRIRMKDLTGQQHFSNVFRVCRS